MVLVQGNNVCRLVKSLYGLKQVSMQLVANPCVARDNFFCGNSKGKLVKIFIF